MPVRIDNRGQIRREREGRWEHFMFGTRAAFHKAYYGQNTKVMLGLLIGANIGVFVAFNTDFISESAMWKYFMFSESNLHSGRWWSMLTYSISHMDIFHLVNNMMALWSAGTILGSECGPLSTFTLYILGALGSAVSHLLFHPKETNKYVIGASGATIAIMTALAVVRPSTTISVPFFPRVPIREYTALYMVTELAQIFAVPNSHIAHAGHFGVFCLPVDCYYCVERQ